MEVNEAKKILDTAGTEGWQAIEHSIIRMMQGLMPAIILEGEEAVKARAEVRAYQSVLNLLTNKVAEARLTLEEDAKKEETKAKAEA